MEYEELFGAGASKLMDFLYKEVEETHPTTVSLSYDKGRPIALNETNGKIVFVDDENKKKPITQIYKMHDKFHQIPNTKKKRETLYISACTGAGKSYYIGKYAKYFRKIFPDKKIYLFSKLGEDESLDHIDPIRITIDEELLNDPIEPKELANSLVIFDDVDTIRDPKLRKEIYKLADDIMMIGRHYGIYLIITSHMLTNYRETRTILNECDSLTIFPKSGARHGISYALDKYIGLDKKQIEKVFRLDSRWVTIFKHYPQCVLYEKGVYLL